MRTERPEMSSRVSHVRDFAVRQSSPDQQDTRLRRAEGGGYSWGQRLCVTSSQLRGTEEVRTEQERIICLIVCVHVVCCLRLLSALNQSKPARSLCGATFFV